MFLCLEYNKIARIITIAGITFSALVSISIIKGHLLIQIDIIIVAFLMYPKAARQLLPQLINEARSKGTNYNKIKKAIAHVEQIDRPTATHCYHLLSLHLNSKQLFDLIKTITSRRRWQQPSLLHLISVLKVHGTYSIPLDSQFNVVKEHVLFNDPSYSQIAALLPLADLKGTQICQFISKAFISWLQSPSTILYPSQLLSLSKLAQKHLTHLPLIHQHLNAHVQPQINAFDQHQLTKVAFIGKIKTKAELRRLALAQNSPIKKRLWHLSLLGCSRVGGLPGCSWRTKLQFKQTVQWLISQGRQMPYVDVLTHTAQQINQCFLLLLKNSQMLQTLIDYLFAFTVHGHFIPTDDGIKSFVKLLQYSQKDLQNTLAQFPPHTLLKLVVVVSHFVRFDPKIRDFAGTFKTNVVSPLRTSNLSQLPEYFTSLTQARTIASFLFTESQAHSGPQQNIFQEILEHTTKKYKNDAVIQQIEELVRFTKSIKDKPINHFSASSTILYSQPCTSSQIIQFIDTDSNRPYSAQKHENLPKQIMKQFAIVKNVVIQPSLKCSFAIVDKTINQLISIVDYDQYRGPTLIFHGSLQQQSPEIQSKANQELMFNYLSWWKHQFITKLLRIPFKICLSQEQLAKEIGSTILK